MNKIELKPCPFCGGEADCNNSGWMVAGVFKWGVECVDCGATSECFDTEEEAIEAWNRRGAMTDHEKALEAAGFISLYCSCINNNCEDCIFRKINGNGVRECLLSNDYDLPEDWQLSEAERKCYGNGKS